MEVKSLFGKRLKELRLKNKLTQEELAEKIGLSSKTLSQIEVGNNFVSAETLDLLCNALDIKPKILFDFDENTSFTKKDLKKDIIKFIEANPENLKFLHKIASALK